MLSDQILAEIERGEGENLVTFAKRIKPTRQGKPVTMTCVLRWITKGVKIKGSNVIIKLEAVRLSEKWITTPGALKRFIVAQTEKYLELESLKCRKK